MVLSHLPLSVGVRNATPPGCGDTYTVPLHGVVNLLKQPSEEQLVRGYRGFAESPCRAEGARKDAGCNNDHCKYVFFHVSVLPLIYPAVQPVCV